MAAGLGEGSRQALSKQPFMATSTALRPSARAAFAGLIDYAGLFPPAQLPIDAAQAEYEAARRGPHAWMLGRFIVAAPLIATWSGVKLPFSVIVDAELDALDRLATLATKNAQIESLEIPLPKGIPADEIAGAIGRLGSDIAIAGLGDVPAFVELPRDEQWLRSLPAAMNSLARSELGGKLRCGGVTAEAFPSVAEVATFILEAHDANVAFKATAGLHHPIRHRDPASGFMMHGFLNLIAAAALAPRVDTETLHRIVGEEEPNAFRFDDTSFSWRGERVDVAELTRTRNDAFVAYGSCSFAEPVEDLSALGLLPTQ
jgi:hypothetical protein